MFCLPRFSHAAHDCCSRIKFCRLAHFSLVLTTVVRFAFGTLRIWLCIWFLLTLSFVALVLGLVWLFRFWLTSTLSTIRTEAWGTTHDQHGANQDPARPPIRTAPAGAGYPPLWHILISDNGHLLVCAALALARNLRRHFAERGCLKLKLDPKY